MSPMIVSLGCADLCWFMSGALTLRTPVDLAFLQSPSVPTGLYFLMFLEAGEGLEHFFNKWMVLPFFHKRILGHVMMVLTFEQNGIADRLVSHSSVASITYSASPFLVSSTLCFYAPYINSGMKPLYTVLMVLKKNCLSGVNFLKYSSGRYYFITSSFFTISIIFMMPSSSSLGTMMCLTSVTL